MVSRPRSMRVAMMLAAMAALPPSPKHQRERPAPPRHVQEQRKLDAEAKQARKRAKRAAQFHGKK